MNLFKRLKLGLTDPTFYKTYLKEGLWKAFLFVLLVNFVAAIPATTITGIRTQQTMNQVSETFKNDFSGIEFKDHTLSTLDGDSLFMDFDLNGISTAIAIDTVDAYSVGDLSNYDSGIIFDTDYILHYEPGYEPMKYYYKDIFVFLGNMHFSLTGNQIASMFAVNGFTLLLVIGATLILNSLFLVVFTTLLISIAASINNSMLKLKMSYANTLKISLYALLLPLLIYQLVSIFPFVPSLLLLVILYFGSGRYIAKTYRNIYTDNLKMALNAYSKRKKQEAEKNESHKDTNKNDHDA